MNLSQMDRVSVLACVTGLMLLAGFFVSGGNSSGTVVTDRVSRSVSTARFEPRHRAKKTCSFAPANRQP